MNFSRRDFVKLGGTAAIASLGLPNFAFGQTNDFFADQTVESLQKIIGTEFYITNNAVSTAVRLTAVKDFPYKTLNGKCFSMEFTVPLEQIKDDCYRVWNADSGNFELFMTAGKSEKSITLNATINCL